MRFTTNALVGSGVFTSRAPLAAGADTTGMVGRFVTHSGTPERGEFLKLWGGARLAVERA